MLVELSPTPVHLEAGTWTKQGSPLHTLRIPSALRIRRGPKMVTCSRHVPGPEAFSPMKGPFACLWPATGPPLI